MTDRLTEAQRTMMREKVEAQKINRLPTLDAFRGTVTFFHHGDGCEHAAQATYAFLKTLTLSNIFALLDENDDLRRERDEAIAWCDNANQAAGIFSEERDQQEVRADRAEANLAALRSLAKEMAEALEPFAEVGSKWPQRLDDDTCVDDEGFCLGQLRTSVLASYRALSEGETDHLPSDQPTEAYREGLNEILARAPEATGSPPLIFVYRNHRSEVAKRRVRPISVRYGSTDWHPEPQWLLRAFDLDKQAEREFAMKEMASASGASDA